MIKKICQFILLCAVILALGSCSGCCSSEPNYNDSVNIALENRDFVKAYRFASKCDMTKSVVSKEAAYVLEEQGEAGLVRIAMIVNEHKAQGIYLDLLKMAISMGNEQLATKIYKMSDACDEQSLDYAVTADMEGLVSTFLSKNPSCIDKQNVIEYLKEKGTYNKLYSEIEKKRQEENTKRFRERIKSILSQVEGTKPPKGLQDYYLGSEMRDGLYMVSNKSNVDYYASSQKVNSQLDELLTEAIKMKNLQLCQEIISSYKETIEVTTGEEPPVKVDRVKVDGDHSYIKFTYSARNEAKKRLEEAIRSGSFK